MRLRIKAAEFCLDVACPDALAATRLLQRSAMAGATAFDRNAYRATAADRDSSPVARWYIDASGAYLKAYAKQPGLLRLEVACPNREAVLAVTRPSNLGIGGRRASLTALQFARGASPLLQKLRAHALPVIEGQRMLPDVLTALQPLISMAAGAPPGAGRARRRGRSSPPGRPSTR
jgi:hypothetical protein